MPTESTILERLGALKEVQAVDSNRIETLEKSDDSQWAVMTVMQESLVALKVSNAKTAVFATLAQALLTGFLLWVFTRDNPRHSSVEVERGVVMQPSKQAGN